MFLGRRLHFIWVVNTGLKLDQFVIYRSEGCQVQVERPCVPGLAFRTLPSGILGNVHDVLITRHALDNCAVDYVFVAWFFHAYFRTS